MMKTLKIFRLNCLFLKKKVPRSKNLDSTKISYLLTLKTLKEGVGRKQHYKPGKFFKSTSILQFTMSIGSDYFFKIVPFDRLSCKSSEVLQHTLSMENEKASSERR